jgi:hypothetical protein
MIGFKEQAMKKGLVLLIGLALAGTAQAQIKCWTGADGKRACGDTPPPGARLDAPRGAPAPTNPAPAADTKKAGTPAPKPQDPARLKREAEAQAAAAKAYLARSPSSGNVQDCERAREMLRKMGGGGRSRQSDAVKARAMADNNCR